VILIVDYGLGNLRSAQKAFEHVGHAATISDTPSDVARADAVVLPGVGAFGDCYEGLRSAGFVAPLLEAVAGGKPFLGICVGMQLLFEGSEEGGGAEGLGVFRGNVVRFPRNGARRLKVPHMGWNQITASGERACPLLANTSRAPYVYFVHSYYARPSDPDVILATCEHGVEFPAMIGRGNVFAVQFHPEKSQKEGLRILDAFGRLVNNV